MLKLIMADIKVLGHRIWTIPVGVFLFVMMFSFVPYLNQVQSFQNWIFAILIPGLLIFELFREEQKNNTDRMLMTMPVSKEKYVWGKYFLVLGFVVIALIAGIISIEILELIRGKEVMNWGVQSFGYDVLHASEWIFYAMMIAIPVYYFTRKLKLSLILGLSMFFTVLYPFFYFQYRYFSIWEWSHNIYEYLYHIAVLIICVLLIQLMSRIFFKKHNKKISISIWFATTMFLFGISIFYISDLISDLSFYFTLKNRLSNALPEISEKGLILYEKWFISIEKRFIGLILILLVLSSVLIIIHRKTKDKFFQHCILLIFLPVLVTILNQYLYNIVNMNFIWNYISGYNLTIIQKLVLKKSTMIPGLLVMIYFSAKASIYLLKNNRTLK
ncbi:MAG: ABC transporter permease subunit [Candidatus Delongbacteria bacterium]|nr:ABC transporter permease subunit [Candidatus Delongbacteria bacterium]